LTSRKEAFDNREDPGTPALGGRGQEEEHHRAKKDRQGGTRYSKERGCHLPLERGIDLILNFWPGKKKRKKARRGKRIEEHLKDCLIDSI